MIENDRLQEKERRDEENRSGATRIEGEETFNFTRNIEDSSSTRESSLVTKSLGSTSDDGGIESRNWFDDAHHLGPNRSSLEWSALSSLNQCGKPSTLWGKPKSQANLGHDRAGQKA